MKKIIFLALIVSSCTSLKFSALSVKDSNNKKLPTLKLVIDENSIENAYSISQTSGSYSNSQNGGTYSEVTTSDPRIQDTRTLIEKETFTNICEELGQSYGSIKYELPIVYKKRNTLGYWLSACGLFVPSLLGVTQVTYEINVEVTTKIFDNNNNLIAKYTSTGIGKEKAKLYGYNTVDASRLANINAIKMAIEKNREKILSDSENISKQLINK